MHARIARKYPQSAVECTLRIFTLRQANAEKYTLRRFGMYATPGTRVRALCACATRRVWTPLTASVATRQAAAYGLTPAAACLVARVGADVKKKTRWVSESEVEWAARLFADRGSAFVGSRYGRPCKRVTIGGLSQFQIERLKDRFNGDIGPERWRCDGQQATEFLRRISLYTTVTVKTRDEMPDANAPRCGQPTKRGTACERIARTDIGLVTCWTHRTGGRGE